MTSYHLQSHKNLTFPAIGGMDAKFVEIPTGEAEDVDVIQTENSDGSLFHFIGGNSDDSFNCVLKSSSHV